jgi:putative DNA primase/helicase
LENLLASGLSNSTIRVNGLRTENGALVFPYRDLDGRVNCFARRRPHRPRVVEGKPVKYEKPKGSDLRAYFPAASLEKLRDGVSNVFITEGEKKTLALSQLGLAAVGIGGIWCGCKKGTDQLIDDLAAVPWAGRTVFIVFDHDEKPSTRQEANVARARLARALRAKGAGEARNVVLPPGPEGAKLGVDDFLVAHGAEAFWALVEQAIPIIPIIAPALPQEAPGAAVIRIIPPVLGEAAYHVYWFSENRNYAFEAVARVKGLRRSSIMLHR